MTQNMGVGPDGTMSPCRAKDPDHCRYHKKGSHVPMSKDKMTEWNESVEADKNSAAINSLSKDSHEDPQPGKNNGMHIMDIENQLKSRLSTNQSIGDLDVYSSYDFDDLVDNIKEYTEENEGITSLNDIDENDLERMINDYATDPDIEDNDGNTISYDSWDNMEDLMEEDDHDAFDAMNDSPDGRSAQELFDTYSKEYKNNNGKDWRPDFSR